MAHNDILTEVHTLDRDAYIEEKLERKLAHDREILGTLRRIRAPKDIIRCGERVLRSTKKRYDAIVKKNEATAFRILSIVFGGTKN